jgi:hypothetical protein
MHAAAARNTCMQLRRATHACSCSEQRLHARTKCMQQSAPKRSVSVLGRPSSGAPSGRSSGAPGVAERIALAASMILLCPSDQNIGLHPSRNSATLPVATEDMEAGKSESMKRRGIVREFPNAHATWTNARMPGGAGAGLGYSAPARDGDLRFCATVFAMAVCATVALLGAGSTAHAAAKCPRKNPRPTCTATTAFTHLTRATCANHGGLAAEDLYRALTDLLQPQPRMPNVRLQKSRMPLATVSSGRR